MYPPQIGTFVRPRLWVMAQQVVCVVWYSVGPHLCEIFLQCNAQPTRIAYSISGRVRNIIVQVSWQVRL